MVDPLTAMSSTLMLQFGLQAVIAPVFASNAAMCLRVWPPEIPTNRPATNTVVFVAVAAYTQLLGPGSHAVAAPVVPSTAARLMRDCPPMWAKLPPTMMLE